MSCKYFLFFNILLLYPCTFGVEIEEVAPRILGGTKCSIDKYPFTVSILYCNPNFEDHCAGVLVTPKWVLTAANCILNIHDEETDSTIAVVAGSSFTLQEFDSRDDADEDDTTGPTMEDGGHKGSHELDPFGNMTNSEDASKGPDTVEPGEAVQSEIGGEKRKRRRALQKAGGRIARDSTGHHQIKKGIQVINHPKFHERHLRDIRYDIALLELDEPFEINEYVQLAKFPSEEDFTRKCDVVLAMGWSENDPNETFGLENVTCMERSFSENQLHCIDLNLAKQNICRKSEAIEEAFIDDTILCTQNKEGEDTCAGDFGGPLLCKDTVIGTIASLDCNDVDSMSFFMSVDQFYDFIKNVTNVPLLKSSGRSAKNIGTRFSFFSPYSVIMLLFACLL